MTKSSNKSGFLIFEFLVVFTLFVIFSSCLLFASSWFSRYVATTELKSLQAFFCYMQQKAVIQQEDMRVMCDANNNQCKEECGQGSCEVFTLHQDMHFQILPNIFGPPASSKQQIEKPITFLNNTIIFYKTGVISSGTIYLVDTQNNTQYALSNAVSQFPYLRLYQNKNGKWETIE